MEHNKLFEIVYQGENTNTRITHCSYSEAIEAVQQGLVRLFTWINVDEHDRYFRLLGRFQDFVIEDLPNIVEATVQREHEEAHRADEAMQEEPDNNVQEITVDQLDEEK